MSKQLKNISVVATATAVSRVLGLVREMFIAASFGTTALSSAFVSAFTLPNLFRRLLGEGALTAAFVPTLTHELEQGQRPAAFTLVSKIASWLLVVTSGIVGVAVVLMFFADPLLRHAVAAGLSDETAGRLLLGADLAMILFPYLILVCLAAVFSAACQVLGRFTEPAFSPVWLNFAIIGALVLGGWWAGEGLPRMHWLCAGVLLGGFFQMLVPAGVLWREGWRPVFDLRPDQRVREMVGLMAPTLIGSAIYLINISVSRFIGLSLNDHAAMVLNLATRVMELPIGVFTAAVATVVFPLFARHAARSDWALLGQDYHKGLRFVLIMNVPAACGLALLSEPIIRLLFQRGEFAASDTTLMTPILAVYAMGLPFLSYTTVALRGFYALKDTTTPVRAAALSFVVNVVLSVVLMQWFGTVGLAVASNVAVLVQAWFLQTRLTRKLAGLGFAPLLPNLLKITLATGLMGAAIWAGLHGLVAMALPTRWHDLAAVAGLIPLAMVVYAALLWVLKIEGRDELAAWLGRWREKFRRAPNESI